jgi:hypothetical protein
MAPGIFYPFRLPIEDDPPMTGCDGGTVDSGDSGANVYRDNICECNNHELELGQPYLVEPGDMIGPTFQGIADLIADDPDAYWDGETVRNSKYGEDWKDLSPRVIKIALFSPDQLVKGGMQELTFNNIALMFLEHQDNPRAPITGRFLYFASGTGTGPTNGSLILYLRLVE